MARRPELTFATFNLYNLQVPGRAMYRGRTYSQAEYDAKIAWTASMLRRIDADIIGFQELWHPDALRDAFVAAGLDGDYQLATKLVPGSISNALAVKTPHRLKDSSWTIDFPKELVLKKRRSSGAGNIPDYKMSVSIDRFSRAILMAKVRPVHGSHRPPEMTVCVAHLKSKLPMRLDKEESRRPTVKPHGTALGSALATIRRVAEAAALRVTLNKAMKGNNRPFVVMGDLNDTEHSVSNTIITADPSYRLFATSRKASKSDVGLYASSSLQEYRSLRDVQYTHTFNGRHETLDHILVSEQFYDYSTRRRWSFKEMKVYNDFLDDEEKATSDHAVVTSTFVYNPAP